VPANDRPTVGELLVDSDASQKTFFEVSSSRRPAIGVATPLRRRLPSQPTCTPE
jgi:hypothetical protein